jgi:hypothetical protein
LKPGRTWDWSSRAAWNQTTAQVRWAAVSLTPLRTLKRCYPRCAGARDGRSARAPLAVVLHGGLIEIAHHSHWPAAGGSTPAAGRDGPGRRRARFPVCGGRRAGGGAGDGARRRRGRRAAPGKTAQTRRRRRRRRRRGRLPGVRRWAWTVAWARQMGGSWAHDRALRGPQSRTSAHPPHRAFCRARAAAAPPCAPCAPRAAAPRRPRTRALGPSAPAPPAVYTTQEDEYHYQYESDYTISACTKLPSAWRVLRSAVNPTIVKADPDDVSATMAGLPMIGGRYEASFVAPKGKLPVVFVPAGSDGPSM